MLTCILATILATIPTAACSVTLPGSAGLSTSEAVTALAPVDDDTVVLTLYLRAGTGPNALLRAVTRPVPVDVDLPRRALALLIAGPVQDEERELDAPLPPTTRVRGFEMDGDTAVVDLSRHVLTDARLVGDGPREEALSLAAIANTLTEFPSVRRVRLLVGGQAPDPETAPDVAAYWGGWGLPRLLVRDESLVEPQQAGDEFPELSRFEEGLQSVGTATAAPVVVTSVRARDRITYLRVVVEVADAADPEQPANELPRTRAWTNEGQAVLELDKALALGDGVDSVGLAELERTPFDSVLVGPADRADAIAVTAQAADGANRPFYLHTQTNPTRIVLDVKK